MITEELCDKKSTLSKLCQDVFLYPQFTINVRVQDKKAIMSNLEVLKAVKQAEETIAGKGRVLLRESGTEPVIRVMVECETKELCTILAEKIATQIKKAT